MSPLEKAIGLETFERYEGALARLSADEQEAIIGRVELGNTYDELAANLGKASPDAARMAVARALIRLAEEMKRGPDDKLIRVAARVADGSAIDWNASESAAAIWMAAPCSTNCARSQTLQGFIAHRRRFPKRCCLMRPPGDR